MLEFSLQVTFKNQASRPYSFYSSLISYEEDQRQGAEPRRKFVNPNETKIYFWTVQHHMAPTKDEFDCKAWAYFSDVDLVSRCTLHWPLAGLKEVDFVLSAKNFTTYCKLHGKLSVGRCHHICVWELSFWNLLKRMNCTMGR